VSLIEAPLFFYQKQQSCLKHRATEQLIKMKIKIMEKTVVGFNVMAVKDFSVAQLLCVIDLP